MAASKGHQLGYMLDTKGPEIRTAMLKGGQAVELNAGEAGQRGGRGSSLEMKGHCSG